MNLVKPLKSPRPERLANNSGHNCWNACELFLPFPFNVDLEDIYGQVNAWNQNWGKGREAKSVNYERLSLCCVFRKCLDNLWPGLYSILFALVKLLLESGFYLVYLRGGSFPPRQKKNFVIITASIWVTKTEKESRRDEVSAHTTGCPKSSFL